MKTLGYKVYKLKSDATTPSDIEGSLDSPAAEGVVDIEDEGYLSVDLKSPLNLQQGEKYAVWFYQTDGNNLYYIVQTRALKNGGAYTSKAVVNKNESFNSYDPTAGWDEIDNSGYDERYVLDNYCVKAYATSCANSSFVKFNSNGGTSVPEQVVPNGGKVTEPAAPTKAGSTFLGWYKDEALSQKFDFDNDTVSADITLFAKWSTVDKTTTADETDEVVTKPATTNTPETPATTSSNEAEQASLTQTGDDLLAIVAAAIAVATVAFIYARRASKRRFHPKHARR